MKYPIPMTYPPVHGWLRSAIIPQNSSLVYGSLNVPLPQPTSSLLSVGQDNIALPQSNEIHTCYLLFFQHFSCVYFLRSVNIIGTLYITFTGVPLSVPGKLRHSFRIYLDSFLLSHCPWQHAAFSESRIRTQ